MHLLFSYRASCDKGEPLLSSPFRQTAPTGQRRDGHQPPLSTPHVGERRKRRYFRSTLRQEKSDGSALPLQRPSFSKPPQQKHPPSTPNTDHNPPSDPPVPHPGNPKNFPATAPSSRIRARQNKAEHPKPRAERRGGEVEVKAARKNSTNPTGGQGPQHYEGARQNIARRPVLRDRPPRLSFPETYSSTSSRRR